MEEDEEFIFPTDKLPNARWFSAQISAPSLPEQVVPEINNDAEETPNFPPRVAATGDFTTRRREETNNRLSSSHRRLVESLESSTTAQPKSVVKRPLDNLGSASSSNAPAKSRFYAGTDARCHPEDAAAHDQYIRLAMSYFDDLEKPYSSGKSSLSEIQPPKNMSVPAMNSQARRTSQTSSRRDRGAEPLSLLDLLPHGVSNMSVKPFPNRLNMFILIWKYLDKAHKVG